MKLLKIEDGDYLDESGHRVLTTIFGRGGQFSVRFSDTKRFPITVVEIDGFATSFEAETLRDRLALAIDPSLAEPTNITTLPVLKFKLVGEGAKLPTKQRKSDVGIDIYTNISEPLTLKPGYGHKFPTGIKSEIPPGYCILLWDRSGIGSKLIVKCAGVIDQEYRGEWFVTLFNLGIHPREFNPGDKIIQGILTPVVDCDIRDVDSHPEENGTLSETERGEKGFGSSGSQ